MKKALWMLAKVGLVAGLLVWLYRSGRLDFGQLRLLIERPETLAALVAIWVVGCVVFGAWRWWLLLRGLGIGISYPRTVWLQSIGLFFNTAMPGSVGGDVIKAVYVIREQEASRKTAALLTVILDRIVGLAGVFVMGAVAILANPAFLSVGPLRAVSLMVVGGTVALVLGFSLVFLPERVDGKDRLERLWSAPVPGILKIKGVIETLKLFRSRPAVLAGALGLTILFQGSVMIFMLLLTEMVTGTRPELAAFATIYSVGVLVSALPLMPGGFGVGHVAFDHLYRLIGLTGGATVFNIWVLGNLSLNLLGFVPYVLYRKRVPAETTAEGGAVPLS